MTTIVTRAGKGSPLTNTEVDSNFTNLNTAKIETLTSTDTSVTITGTGSSRDLSVPVNPNVVSGPASATDNAVVRFDTTTGKLVQNSSVTIDDSGNESGTLSKSFTPTTAPSYSEGRVWYDSTEKALAFYNDSSSIAVHVGQDLIFKVINNTGSTIANGAPVYITGTSSGQTYPNVALAKADVAATSSVIGLTNGAIANGAIGYVTSQGTIDNVNTSTYTVGQVLYLSPYSAGQLMNTLPPTGITVQVGVVTYVNSTTGHIYVKQTTPLSIPASIISGTVAVVNGGTGQSSYTDGQLLIGNSTGNTLTKSTLTAGTGVSVTNAAGSITVANTGVTSVTASTGISVSASTGGVTITNTAPDQTVAISSGTGISVTGTYPNFTVASTVTGASITDDTTTNATYYPLFSTATTGSLSAVRVSSTKYTYNPSTGVLSSTVHTSTSDERLKTNWKPLSDNFVSQLAKVKSGTFDRIDFKTTDVGVGAQSLQPLLPQAVITGEDGYLSVNYGGAALVAAIELAKVVEELRAEIAALKAKVGE